MYIHIYDYIYIYIYIYIRSRCKSCYTSGPRSHIAAVAARSRSRIAAAVYLWNRMLADSGNQRMISIHMTGAHLIKQLSVLTGVAKAHSANVCPYSIIRNDMLLIIPIILATIFAYKYSSIYYIRNVTYMLLIIPTTAACAATVFRVSEGPACKCSSKYNGNYK